LPSTPSTTRFPLAALMVRLLSTPLTELCVWCSGVVNWWDKESKQRLKPWTRMSSPVTATAFSHDGQAFVFATGAQTVLRALARAPHCALALLCRVRLAQGPAWQEGVRVPVAADLRPPRRRLHDSAQKFSPMTVSSIVAVCCSSSCCALRTMVIFCSPGCCFAHFALTAAFRDHF
jgi:hypothetical protein